MPIVSPPPVTEPFGSYRWIDWFNKLNVEINEVTNVTWSNINFTGSDITDIVSRNHNDLGAFDGGGAGERYHLTQTEHDKATGEEPFKLKSYTVAGAPTASSYTNHIIYVSNGAAGNPVVAFSDGTNWLRCDTLAAISAS